MPIRVMHVVNNLGKGGLENGLVNLISRLDPGRFEHVVCTIRGLGPHADRLKTVGAQVMTLAESGSTSRFQTPALIQAIRRVQPDIVHSRNWAAIEAVVAGRLAGGAAVVHSEHGFEADIGAAEPWRRICFRRVAFGLADRVFSVSFQLRDLHARRTRFPASRIAVIHNGVDRTRFSPDSEIRARMRRELALRDSDFCMGCVANLLPVKDHMTLLTAVACIAQDRDDWRLLLIGDGSERSRLQAFVDRHPWKTRVVFMGSSGDVPNLLRAMDVFVLPSIAEGICNSLLEAMSTGLPAIATAVGGTPEVLVDGESGLLFPVRDASALAQRLVQLHDQPDLRARLGARAIQRVRDEFSIESMVQAYDDFYASLRPVATAPAVSVH